MVTRQGESNTTELITGMKPDFFLVQTCHRVNTETVKTPGVKLYMSHFPSLLLAGALRVDTFASCERRRSQRKTMAISRHFGRVLQVFCKVMQCNPVTLVVLCSKDKGHNSSFLDLCMIPQFLIRWHWSCSVSMRP